MKQIYEVLDECKQAESAAEVANILRQNDSTPLRTVLYHAYHPKAQWYISEFPEKYKKPDTFPGMSMTNLYSELRRIYLFQKGHPEADKLSESRRQELLLQTIEGMEPAEAEVFINIMKGDLGVELLNVEVINEVFPNLIT